MKRLSLIAVVLLVVFGCSVARSQVQAKCPNEPGEPTAAENVLMVLTALGVDKTVVITECYKSHVIARRATLSNGTPNDGLRQYILQSRAFRIKLKIKIKDQNTWLHDNTVFSRFEKNGKYSYRQAIRPSMQVVFFIKDGDVDYIKIDLDRFPPGGNSPVSTARHFSQEQIPNTMFGKSTDQTRMAESVRKVYGTQTAVVQNQVVVQGQNATASAH